MRTMTTLTLLGTLAIGSAAALAGESLRTIDPTAPSLVRELDGKGTATVGGTVLTTGRDGHFVLADAEEDRLTVDAGALDLEGLAPGQMVTVTGRLDGDELAASHAIREDGSIAIAALDEDEAELEERD